MNIFFAKELSSIFRGSIRLLLSSFSITISYSCFSKFKYLSNKFKKTISGSLRDMRVKCLRTWRKRWWTRTAFEGIDSKSCWLWKERSMDVKASIISNYNSAWGWCFQYSELLCDKHGLVCLSQSNASQYGQGCCFQNWIMRYSMVPFRTWKFRVNKGCSSPY